MGTSVERGRREGGKRGEEVRACCLREKKKEAIIVRESERGQNHNAEGKMRQGEGEEQRGERRGKEKEGRYRRGSRPFPNSLHALLGRKRRGWRVENVKGRTTGRKSVGERMGEECIYSDREKGEAKRRNGMRKEGVKERTVGD